MFYPRLYLSCQFEIVEIGGEVMAISVGDKCGEDISYNGVILLKNESTRFMFEKLQKGITLPELIKVCTDKYNDSTVEEISPLVISFLDKLKEQGLIISDMRDGIEVED